MDFRADNSGSRADASSPSVSTKGFNPGEGAWVEALIAFYERDCLPQKAANLRNGAPLDYLDWRTINALKVAFERIGA